MKNINLKRLKTTLTEYCLLNKSKLISIPVVVVVLYLLAMFWYGTPLFNQLFFRTYPDSNSFAEMLANYNGRQNKELILFTIPLYIILCTIPYFKLLTKTVYGTMTPVSRGERMVTLWVGNLVIIFGILLSFFVMDLMFTSIMKSMYLDDVIAYRESVGDLYYTYENRTYFATSEREIYTVVSILSLSFACLYQLSTIFFRKYSIPLFALMLLVFFYVAFKVFEALYRNVNYRFDTSEISFNAMVVLFSIVAIGVVVTTYFKLREKEIY
ncbi:hypothetical protein [Sphingobacterium corticibacter]|uniref:hypothetical protein n=1 Tax=Sphingobacterium corticibacter TaxID=2171749 RepID=UPI000E315B9D|nr:hypothetical protein [Sphingobacterium corticibacter]